MRNVTGWCLKKKENNVRRDGIGKYRRISKIKESNVDEIDVDRRRRGPRPRAIIQNI